ncbi:unnamed protein product [Moneuplotes crassus]|uniref:Uncharacterized protein n=1 Tax=Euplotes crassus TaxID=5936 RepID=A0AAD1TZ78_EUPCR|nr:unnamed protein product [Moneuplotes crassus]
MACRSKCLISVCSFDGRGVLLVAYFLIPVVFFKLCHCLASSSFSLSHLIKGSLKSFEEGSKTLSRLYFLLNGDPDIFFSILGDVLTLETEAFSSRRSSDKFSSCKLDILIII